MQENQVQVGYVLSKNTDILIYFVAVPDMLCFVLKPVLHPHQQSQLQQQWPLQLQQQFQEAHFMNTTNGKLMLTHLLVTLLSI